MFNLAYCSYVQHAVNRLCKFRKIKSDFHEKLAPILLFPGHAINLTDVGHYIFV